MKKFAATVIREEKQTQIEFIGKIDEDAVLPSNIGVNKVLIKAGGIKQINSSGLKIWLIWVNSLQCEVHLFECPFVFAKHFSTVRGVLTDRITVRSFYVPYVDESGEERKDVLYQIGIDFQPDGSYKARQVRDSKGVPMEMDVNESNYFRFLKRTQT